MSDSDFDNIRNENEFKMMLDIYYNRGEYVFLLTKYMSYSYDIPEFTYQSPHHPRLVDFRMKCHLDSILGNKNEVTRIVHLMQWVYNVCRYNSKASIPRPLVDWILRLSNETEENGIDSEFISNLLNIVYLSMDFKSRIVTCLPMGEGGDDYRVLNIVYSKILDKWLWMDAKHGIYIADEHNNLLSIREVRGKIVCRDSLIVCTVMNSSGDEYFDSGRKYLYEYMAKYLFRFSCPKHSGFEHERKKKEIIYINLYPTAYNPISVEYGKKYIGLNHSEFFTDNPDAFWRSPF